jgi:thiol-disulfide isomerase/thioredoxin
MSAGLIALLAALACAVAGGLLWRRGNGRMRVVRAGQALDVPPADQEGNGLARTEPGLPAPEPAGQGPGTLLTAGQLGHELGARATLVQFSSAFCAPCRATRRILADVAGEVDGVTHVEIDAESRLDLVRSLNVLRTPTVLVTDSAGRVVRRASGQPRKADVLAAVGEAVEPVGASEYSHISDRKS